jgi:hypothetical protein
MKVGDQRKDLFRRRLDGGRALHPQRVRLGRGENENRGDGNRQYDGDDSNDFEHAGSVSTDYP